MTIATPHAVHVWSKTCAKCCQVWALKEDHQPEGTDPRGVKRQGNLPTLQWNPTVPATRTSHPTVDAGNWYDTLQWKPTVEPYCGTLLELPHHTGDDCNWYDTRPFHQAQQANGMSNAFNCYNILPFHLAEQTGSTLHACNWYGIAPIYLTTPAYGISNACNWYCILRKYLTTQGDGTINACNWYGSLPIHLAEPTHGHGGSPASQLLGEEHIGQL
jgi:hypothetical protein